MINSRVDIARRYRPAVAEEPTQALRERLARRIRELAKSKGVTLTDLADRAGVSQAGFWLAMSGIVARSMGLQLARRSHEATKKLLSRLAPPDWLFHVPEEAPPTRQSPSPPRGCTTM